MVNNERLEEINKNLEEINQLSTDKVLWRNLDALCSNRNQRNHYYCTTSITTVINNRIK